MYKYKAWYLGNYDGDIIKFRIDLGFSTFKEKVLRIAYITTCGLEDAETDVREKGYVAKYRIRELLESAKEIIIETDKNKDDEYIVEVYYDGINLIQQLVDEDLAETC